MRYFFTLDDLEKAKRIVETRQIGKRINSIKNSKISKKKTEFEIDYHGVLAEMSVASVLGIDVDSSEMLHGDDGYDLMFNGKKIEVKFSFYPNADLIMMKKTDLKADFYILVIGNDVVMNVIGIIPKETFLSNGIIANYGHGDRFVVPQSKLSWDVMGVLKAKEGLAGWM